MVGDKEPTVLAQVSNYGFAHLRKLEKDVVLCIGSYGEGLCVSTFNTATGEHTIPIPGQSTLVVAQVDRQYFPAYLADQKFVSYSNDIIGQPDRNIWKTISQEEAKNVFVFSIKRLKKNLFDTHVFYF